MYRHPETNPHFVRPLQQQREGQPSVTSGESGRDPERRDKKTAKFEPQQSDTPKQDGKPPKGKIRNGKEKHPKPHPDDTYPSPSIPGAHHHDEQDDYTYQSPRMPPAPYHGQDQGPHRDGKFHSTWMYPTVEPGQDKGPPVTKAKHKDQQHDGSEAASPQHGNGGGLQVPKPYRTRATTWFLAVCCAIFWIAVFLGGLIVLIVYLIYRPLSPRFDVSSATLNAAYIDAGSLLNADLSLLANFTNPNRKVRVDFSYIIVDLYYGNTLIAAQYIEPFSAARAESRFANVELVTSQVRLPSGEGIRLQEQINKNEIIFDIKGVFRVRSNLGSFLRYSYRLYAHCAIMVTAPPSGILRAVRCRTKR